MSSSPQPPGHRPKAPANHAGASANRPRLIPLGQPRVVDVRTDEHGEPAFVRMRGKPARGVESIQERWRIDDEWWREPISREYRVVVLDDGRHLTLYHDLMDGTWYAQRS